MTTKYSRMIIFVILSFVLTTSIIYSRPASSQLVTRSEEGPTITMDSGLRTRIVYQDKLNFPTSMSFLGPDDIVVLEKNNGTVKRIVNGNMLPEPLLDVNVANKNERGMLGIAVTRNNSLLAEKTGYIKHKQESEKLYVFLYYTESKDKDGEDVTDGKEPLGNRLYRYELVNNKLVNPKLLLDLPTTPTGLHNGGKLAIGQDNNVYIIVGDLGTFDMYGLKTRTQNFKMGNEPMGSAGILRITLDGRAVGEGILGKDHWLQLYFAYGIRNGFGIAFDPLTNNLWDTENGPSNGDEINLVKPGFNSGWSKVQGIWTIKNGKIMQMFHDKKVLVNFNGTGAYSTPEFVWNKTVGTTDMLFFNSSKLGKNYENDMFVGDFHNGYLYHFDLTKNRTKLSLHEPLLDKIANSTEEMEKVIFARGFGGITDLEVGPDGYLYVLSLYFGGPDCDPDLPDEPCVQYNGTNSGSIYKIVPINK